MRIILFFSHEITWENIEKIYVSTRIRTRVFFTDTRGEFLHGDLHLSYTFYEIEKCKMYCARKKGKVQNSAEKPKPLKNAN